MRPSASGSGQALYAHICSLCHSSQTCCDSTFCSPEERATRSVCCRQPTLLLSWECCHLALVLMAESRQHCCHVEVALQHQAMRLQLFVATSRGYQQQSSAMQCCVLSQTDSVRHISCQAQF